MDLGGTTWTLIIIGVALLVVVLVWAMLRKRGEPEAGIERTEQATDRLYREEDAARDPMDDGIV